MRRVVAFAVVLALAGAVTAAPTAEAGVDGELDTFAVALDDLADEALAVGAVLSTRPVAPADAAELAVALGDLRTAVSRVAAAGGPLADHLATGRLSPARAADVLHPPIRSLAVAVERLVDVASPSGPARLLAAEEPSSPVELLAPAIQALARTFQSLAPALEAVRPVVEPLAPVIDPACGQLPGVVFLALGLAPVLAPVPLPALPESPTVLAGSVLAPVFLLCASLPVPADDAPAGAGQGDDATAGPPPEPAPPSPPPTPELTVGGSTTPPRLQSPASGLAAAVDRAPAVETGGTAAPALAATTGSARPRLVSGMPLLPVDHDGEATAIALLVLAAAAVAAGITVRTRRRQGFTDWAVPAAAGTGVGALAAGAMAWNGAAEQVATWAQIPYVVSGGLTAFVLGVMSISLAVAGPLARVAAGGK